LPDPSIFSTEHNREGIQVGTAIATLVRKLDHRPITSVEFRHLWGTQKRQELIDTAETDPTTLYSLVAPPLELGLPFVSTVVGAGYFEWVSLPHLFPTSFPGVKTSRDEFLVDIDRDALDQRIAEYFDPKVGNEDIRARYPQVMAVSDRFDPAATRATLLKRGSIAENIVRYAYRPFDVRWLYWEPETKLLDEKRSEYQPHSFVGNNTLATQQKPRGEWQSSQIVQSIACLDLIDRGSSNFPMALKDLQTGEVRPNLSKPVHDFLANLKIEDSAAFYGALATLHAPAYRTENEGALRMDWPRVPIPGEAHRLNHSAALGESLATLLNPERLAPGVSSGLLRSGLRVLGLPTKRGGSHLAPLTSP
jgi:hypothetical protein